jgi:hypothetical protein
VVVVGGIAAGTASSLLGAPSPTAAARNRASVVLVDRLEIPANMAARRSADAPVPRAVVIRRPAGLPGARNLILVTRETQPADLDKAVSQLITAIRKTPEVKGEARAFISAARANPTAGRDRSQAARDLQRLATANTYRFEGVGRQKAIGIRLKPQAPKPRR